MSILSWNQIRANAAQFSDSWKDAHYEKGDTQTFYNEFFEVFGHRRRNVALYEKKVDMVGRSHGFIDLFWPGMLIVEQKSAGRNLDSASTQVDDYILALSERERPRYRLISDFQNFVFTDLATRQIYTFKLDELKNNIKLFDFIAGRRQQIYKDQDPVNIDASDKMSSLHKVLEDSGYGGTDLERLLVRIMFCLFADDTGIFEQDSLLNYIRDRTHTDGSDLGSKLIELFQVLDTPKEKRQKMLDEDLASFPYVNGKLFNGSIRTPSFNNSMRDVLLDCCYFNWTEVSPALFGSLFQTVILPEKQRQSGAHYTSEKNILKTIQPLFMEELQEEFSRLKNLGGTQRRSKIEQFHISLSKLTFLDPACGCGNFLILAYRELRLLELDILDELYPRDNNGDRQNFLDVDHLSLINVDQFYGIEISEFPVYIAQTAMWLIDHQMNMKLGDMFGQAFARLPLQKTANIYHGNALTVDWNEVIPASKCSYIFGNPPFIGKAYRNNEQQSEMKKIFKSTKGTLDLDYVVCWFYIAAHYIQKKSCQVAFVSTNSICQGEQVPIFWALMMEELNIHINFAHRTFKWIIDAQKAKGMNVASVYVVIVGFSTINKSRKKIFDYETISSDPHELNVKKINPYLLNADTFFIKNRKNHFQKNCVPQLSFGSMPNDGGFLILNDNEARSFIQKEPKSKNFIKPFLGSREFINNLPRYCLWLKNCSPSNLKSMPIVIERVEAVRKQRLKSTRPPTNKLAQFPWLFGEIRQPNQRYIAIPEVSSQSRDYIPIGFLDKDTIASNKLYTISNGNLYHFGIVTSKMHMIWMKTVGGRLKNDYQYSNGIVYNNFSWPEATDMQKEAIAKKAQAILDARSNHKESSLADLYNPNLMPVDLRKAHNALDKEVDKTYRKEPFNSELERIQFLFERYQKLTQL
ncbi:MAG TPA: N-6 DNA methylase [Oligoflexia bacterium]|nr:N-6 DNA methylase [Oligoflexia bacterium]HMR25359.1 N-6 DNA methylase [Oligoflexia bacterium]